MQILCFINSCSCSPFYWLDFEFKFLLCGFLERSTHLLFQFFQSSRLRPSHVLWPDPASWHQKLYWTQLVPDCLLCAAVNWVWLLITKDSLYFSSRFCNKSGSFPAVFLTNLELLFKFVYNPLLIHTVQQFLTITIRHHPRHPWVMFTEIWLSSVSVLRSLN